MASNHPKFDLAKTFWKIDGSEINQGEHDFKPFRKMNST